MPTAETTIHIPTLKSSRLLLRALRPDDHPHLLDMAHDAEVMQHPNEGPPPSAEEVWRRMMFALGQWALRGYGMWAVEDHDGFASRLDLYHPYDEADLQLSYIMCRRTWGKGLAREGSGLARDWMFTSHRFSRLVSHIARANPASAHVAARLGAVHDGAVNRGDVMLDVWIY